MKQHLIAFLTGLLFASGLILSGMTQPSKIIGFLDFTGTWDPTLAFVMGGALLVFIPMFQWIRKKSRPVLTDSFHISSQKNITLSLILGSAIFGIGWGLSGFCPGPTITSLPTLSPNAIGVAIGMVIGIFGLKFFVK